MLSHPTIAVSISPEFDLIWRKCHKLGNGMRVRNTAYRIFPTLVYNITGLDPESFYKISLHLDSEDNKKMREEELVDTLKMVSSRKVWHRLGCQTGENWMKRTISFDSVRITTKKSLEDDRSDVIYCPSGYWYSPVMTIYKNDVPIHTSCILHTVFKAVTNIQSKELRDYKSSLNKYAKAGFIMRRDADQRIPFSIKEPRSPAQGASTTSENRFTAQFVGSPLSYPAIPVHLQPEFIKAHVTTLPPNVNSPRILRDVPMIPPTANPILFNTLPVYQNLNQLFNPFWNPMGNLLTNVFHSPSITPPTNSTTPSDKATDDDEEEEINITDL